MLGSGAPVNSQYAKQCALAVWAAAAGTLLFFGSSGTKEEGVAESREETQPREIRVRGSWEGVLLIINHLQFQVRLLEEPLWAGMGLCTQSPAPSGSVAQSPGSGRKAVTMC